MGSMIHIFSFQTASDGVWQPSSKPQCSSWETACDDFTVGITKQQTVQKPYYSQVAESQTKHRSRLRSWPRLHYVNSNFCYNLMPRMVTCIWIMLNIMLTGRFVILRSFMVFLSSFIHLRHSMQISHCSSLPVSSNLSPVILLFKDIHSEILSVIQKTNKNEHWCGCTRPWSFNINSAATSQHLIS